MRHGCRCLMVSRTSTCRNKRFGNSGRKPVDFAKLNEALREVPLKNRTTQRAVAAELGISQQVRERNLDKIGIHASKRFLRPLLTDAGETRRPQWALSWIRSGPGGSRRFAINTMDNVCMVDEKWFYVKKQGEVYYCTSQMAKKHPCTSSNTNLT